jgi:outer membrane protein assembly factor BamB
MTTLALVLLSAAVGRADDWPQWMGPDRDNVWKETGVVETFPAGGPKVLWRTPLAGAYSGPAVADGKVYVTDYVTKDKVKEGNWEGAELTGIERVHCLNEADGKEVWKHEYPVKYRVSYPNGPRCTPLVSGGKVYTLGAEGDLICFAVGDAKKIVWQKNLKDTYKNGSPLWGYAAHPLIDGQKLITLAGGDGSHVVALNKDTGEEIWKAESSNGKDEVGYCPPTIVTIGGVRQLVLLKPKAFTALDPETGKRLWTQPYTADNGSIIMTPIVVGDYVFGGGWNNKNLLLKISTGGGKQTAETVWKDKRGFGVSAVNVQPMLVDSVLYGIDQNGKLYAVELPSGKRLWETDEVVGRSGNSETAFIVKNGDRFFFFTEKGDLVIGKLSPKGYEEVSRANVLKPTHKVSGRTVVWSMPAFANKKLFARNDEEIVCVDLAK